MIICKQMNILHMLTKLAWRRDRSVSANVMQL